MTGNGSEGPNNEFLEAEAEKDDRTIYLDAVLAYVDALGMSHDARCMFDRALRLGFAIGTSNMPLDLVPSIAVRSAMEARSEREKELRQISEDRGPSNGLMVRGQGFRPFGRLW